MFETPRGGWAAVIGDVCGKGVEAATLTGLARHTLRAISNIERPSQALAALNGALLRERLDGRFCTVAYVMIEPDPRGGARLLLASGGHPLPQHISRDGATERVGRHGTLLGVTEDPQIDDVEVRLDPGDALVMFTDGILRRHEASGDEPEGLDQGPPAARRRARPPSVLERVRRYVHELIAEERDGRRRGPRARRSVIQGSGSARRPLTRDSFSIRMPSSGRPGDLEDPRRTCGVGDPQGQPRRDPAAPDAAG